MVFIGKILLIGTLLTSVLLCVWENSIDQVDY